jgi:hypothetical protein
MAYASELVGTGFSPGQAGGVGGQYTALVAAGSTQATGTPVTASMSVVTAADGTKGVTLKGQKGDEVWLFNDSGSTLKVYPPVGAAIAVVGTGVGTVNAAFSQLTYGATIYKCLTSTQWLAVSSA